MKLEIEVMGKGKALAELDDRNPQTSKKIYENLPLEGNAQVWLEETYFQISINMDYENPSSASVKGDLSYWPPGSAFCIFYGESQPASEVNHIGRVLKNMELFRNVEDDDKIILRKI
ncbi:MAG: cyclophilin-like fold protein [Methanobacterium sp.]